MLNTRLKDYVTGRLLPRVQTPAQYVGGELNMVRKDHRPVRGKLCLAFPDTYTIGMSHHGLQVLYSLMNAPRRLGLRAGLHALDRHGAAAARARDCRSTAWRRSRRCREFDVLGFTLQYEICYTQHADDARPGRHSAAIAASATLSIRWCIAGGPCAQNPEPLAPFVDVFVTGDGEPSLPLICDEWLELQGRVPRAPADSPTTRPQQREEMLAELAARLPFAYVPRFYEPEYADGRFVGLNRTRSDVPETIEPAVIADLDGIPLPTRPIVPYVECVHDRIAIEIMRGCPWQCRFCQSTVIKRPLRIREVETIVAGGARDATATRATTRSRCCRSRPATIRTSSSSCGGMHEVFNPLGVNISVPSLRVNEQLRSVAALMGSDRQTGLTLAPEVARDDMREQIRKKIKNEDLYEGCRAGVPQRLPAA